MKMAMDDGIKFYMSKNGVILSSGNDLGVIDIKYIKSIKYRNEVENYSNKN
jgi:hypothetical protein